MNNCTYNWTKLLPSARGIEPADVVFKGGMVVNVFSGRLERLDLAVTDGWIVGLGNYNGREEVDVTGRFLTPGLIEPHLHLESTMVTPGELARVIVPRGTTALIVDPHEIANVLGGEGISYLMDLAIDLPLDIFFMAPSCVPATHLETSGAKLSARDLEALLSRPQILGLAEVMNFPGVIQGVAQVWDKINLFAGRPVDGHAPLLQGLDLNAYALAGMATEHECTNLEEAREKLARGIRIFIREGSQARNLASLLPLVNDHNYRRISFCTDDRHPEDLMKHGHLDYLLRLAVGQGLDPVRAVTMSTLNVVEAYGLPRRGALAPGYRADVVVFNSLETFVVNRVYKNGRLVVRDGQLTIPIPAPPAVPDWARPMNVAAYEPETLNVTVTGPRVRVIEYWRGQILTGHLIEDAPQHEGKLCADVSRDLVRLVVMERYQASGRIGQGLIKGLGMHTGALASSVAHDSHNLVAAGLGSAEIYLALKTVQEMGGGLAVVAGSRVISKLPLPLAGLISNESLPAVAAALEQIKAAAQELGCRMINPFMALSFMALPVIPHLKLTDLGLVDVVKFALTTLFTD